jgi:hypothetical protein
MHRCLLVPHQNVLKLVLLENRVVDVQNGAAGVAEDVFDCLRPVDNVRRFLRRSSAFHNLSKSTGN